MATEPDDAGLSWGDETDPTHVDAPVVDEPGDGTSPGEPGTSSALLVTLGVFGGIFLLFTVGWIIGVQRSTVPSTGLFFVFMYRLGQVLAVLAPAAWFVGVLVLARDRRSGVRILLLLLGVVLLAPWPFILGLGA
ncbi:hypothetical protein F1C58_03665 [Glaciihabitans sp. INWT7]|uniref:hypothetical protein n=1 Tax=Glaciihabitans sp. INWT7 TaxID=2596912 RepID=UPI001629A284|nr:hypothetical protein [Glaciihabitans sp. INWT7]QNE46097.1 hypothetical protein F1C58_03665 [Glaciihabitans sp. INWT7]